MNAAPHTQRALAALASDAISVGAGGRLPTSVEYQSRLGVGAGTVQQALRVLEAAGALETVSRGHQGRHVVRLDVGSLWSLGHFPPVRMVLPPPGAVELYGLLDGLHEHFGALGVPFTIAHRRGGSGRVAGVAAGTADATLLSAGAAQKLVTPADGLATEDLGTDTYYAPDTIVVLRRPGAGAGNGPLRVGIDRASFDHARLTQAEFPEGDGVEYVACDFPSMPVAVLEGRVDAGIWHRLLLLIPPQLAGVEVTPLRASAALAVRRELSAAVVIVSPRRPEVAAVCHHLDGAAIRARQQKLLQLDTGAEVLAERYWFR